MSLLARLDLLCRFNYATQTLLNNINYFPTHRKSSLQFSLGQVQSQVSIPEQTEESL